MSLGARSSSVSSPLRFLMMIFIVFVNLVDLLFIDNYLLIVAFQYLPLYILLLSVNHTDEFWRVEKLLKSVLFREIYLPLSRFLVRRPEAYGLHGWHD